MNARYLSVLQALNEFEMLMLQEFRPVNEMKFSDNLQNVSHLTVWLGGGTHL